MSHPLPALILSLLFLTVVAQAAETDWELKKEEKGISIYTRSVEGSKHKAVRGMMTIDAPLNAAVGLVSDTSTCPDWADLCKEAIEVERISETELYVYSYNDIPWPVADRDAITHVVWAQDPESLSVSMTAIATDRTDRTSKAVRIEYAVTQWIFTPAADGRLKVITEAHIDPNGPVPAWITNLLLVESPLKTMGNLRSLLESGRYADAEFAFLTLPGEKNTPATTQ